MKVGTKHAHMHACTHVRTHTQIHTQTHTHISKTITNANRIDSMHAGQCKEVGYEI